MVGGGGFEPPKLSRQIYSLIPLAARESPPKMAAYFLCPEAYCQPINASKEKMELARGVEPPTG